jgi:hypothetical protein
MAVFSDVVPCSLVEIVWRFSGAYCLHHQGDLKRPSDFTNVEGATCQKPLLLKESELKFTFVCNVCY